MEKEKKYRKRDLNKMNDMVFRCWVYSDLKKDILSLREKYDVPKEGFFSRENINDLEEEERKKAIDGLILREKWEIEKDKKELFDDLLSLARKHKLPPHLLLLLKEYLCEGPPKNPINDVVNFLDIDIDLYALTKDTGTLKQWDASGIPYISIIIPSCTKRKDAQRALKDLWKGIEGIWKDQGWIPPLKKKRIIIDKDIKDRIIELMKEPKSSFENSETEYKEIIVEKIIRKEFPKRKIPSFENIRIIYQNYKNKT